MVSKHLKGNDTRNTFPTQILKDVAKDSTIPILDANLGACNSHKDIQLHCRKWTFTYLRCLTFKALRKATRRDWPRNFSSFWTLIITILASNIKTKLKKDSQKVERSNTENMQYLLNYSFGHVNLQQQQWNPYAYPREEKTRKNKIKIKEIIIQVLIVVLVIMVLPMRRLLKITMNTISHNFFYAGDCCCSSISLPPFNNMWCLCISQSKPDPRQFFWWANSPLPRQKESSKPRPPGLWKRAKTPPPGHFPQLFTIKTWKMIQKSCKTARFYNL